MPPFAAVGVWAFLLVLLYRFDPAKESKSSPALWISIVWLFIATSRLPSQWTNIPLGSQVQTIEEGNSLDRVVYTTLILAGLGVIFSRRVNWGRLMAQNLPLTIFVVYALISVMWSDFPLIAFKRWFRDLGNYLAILIVLTDPRPGEAIRTVLRRVFYAFVPLSIILIKYFPNIGREFERWSGMTHYVGGATSKNMLGVACLVSGMFFFWDSLRLWKDRKSKPTRRILEMNAAYLAMTLWLLKLASSATSTVCLFVGWGIIFVAQMKTVRRNPAMLKALVPSILGGYVVLSMGFGIDLVSMLSAAVGRDPTFTGRTNIWNAVLSTHTNPILGTGYESFWLGERLEQVWRLAGHYNEAHNGYLEMYLNLGFVGLAILAALLISIYRSVCKRLTHDPLDASFAFAMWVVLLFYNVTEAAFRGQLMWIVFLMAAMTVSAARDRAVSRSKPASVDSSPAVMGEMVQS